jgi:hypothetical protein
METQFREKGVVDILIFYLKRMNCKINDVKLLKWNNIDMSLLEDIDNSNVCYIKFQQSSGKISELYFFSKDLSDGGLKSDTSFFKWIKNKSNNKNMVSLTKSASYLMSTDMFSNVRNFILNNSKIHIQDDSGIGYNYITNSKRRFKLYGSYSKVIPLFKSYYQKNLYEDYKKDSNIKKLPFSIGYNLSHNETNLLVMY